MLSEIHPRMDVNSRLNMLSCFSEKHGYCYEGGFVMFYYRKTLVAMFEAELAKQNADNPSDFVAVPLSTPRGSVTSANDEELGELFFSKFNRLSLEDFSEETSTGDSLYKQDLEFLMACSWKHVLEAYSKLRTPETLQYFLLWEKRLQRIFNEADNEKSRLDRERYEQRDEARKRYKES